MNAFAAEVTRVAREVARKESWVARAQVPTLPAHGKDLTDNVNVKWQLNLNRTGARHSKVVTLWPTVNELHTKTHSEREGRGSGSRRKPSTHDQYVGYFPPTRYNGGPRSWRRRATEAPGERTGAAGTWKDLTGNVNLLADNLTIKCVPSRSATALLRAMDSADSSRRQGEVLNWKDNINTHDRDNVRLTPTAIRNKMAEKRSRSLHRNVAGSARK